MTPLRTTYALDASWDQNRIRGPKTVPLPDLGGPRPITTRVHDLGLASPLGIPAGLLLDSKWIALYAALGFDTLLYKTVRSRAYPSHPPPNCVFLPVAEPFDPQALPEEVRWDPTFVPDSIEEVTITNSFGAPCVAPIDWQADAEIALGSLGSGQILVMSGMGTAEPGMTLGELAGDYARTTAMARETGAHVVELNLSCPNTGETSGAVFSDPEAAAAIARACKAVLGPTPLWVKMGYVADPAHHAEVVSALAPHIDGIAAINTIKTRVPAPDGKAALGQTGRLESGICGAAIRSCGLEMTRRLVRWRTERAYDYIVIGVGGVMTPEHVKEYLDVGCDLVQTCTGAMFDPYLAHRFAQARGLVPAGG
jgi:dihydroorotate dehydrogenase